MTRSRLNGMTFDPKELRRLADGRNTPGGWLRVEGYMATHLDTILSLIEGHAAARDRDPGAAGLPEELVSHLRKYVAPYLFDIDQSGYCFIAQEAADTLERLARELAEADAVIAHMYGDFPKPGQRREPHPNWRRHEAEAIERHALRQRSTE